MQSQELRKTFSIVAIEISQGQTSPSRRKTCLQEQSVLMGRWSFDPFYWLSMAIVAQSKPQNLGKGYLSCDDLLMAINLFLAQAHSIAKNIFGFLRFSAFI